MKTIFDMPRWLSALRNTIAVVALTVLGAGVALAMPLAGTTIGNQAAATYTDASAMVRTATSNTVVTTVLPVAALTLVNTQTKIAAPGQPLTFPHTLTNTGNGIDTFNLTSTFTTGTALLSAFIYYPDNNCDGAADAGLPSITAIGPMAAGARTCFVAITTVGGAAPADATGSNIVTATSTTTGTVNASNTDSVLVNLNAVIGVRKSMSVAAGAGGSVNLTYTLTYSNTGNTTATNLVLTDRIPTGTTYVASSGRWSGSGATVLTENVAASAPGAGNVSYDYNVTTPGAPLTVTAIVGSVAANSSGSLSFTVNVPATAAPGLINNFGRFCYNNGAALEPLAHTPANCASGGNLTNVVPYNVLPTYGVLASDYFMAPSSEGAAATTPTDSSTTDVSGTKDDIVLVASATQGGTVVFDNVIANAGNASDIFNITLNTIGNTFPSGTTFLLFKSDGVTPLTNSNGDGTVDTGPMTPGSTYHVFVKAILPATALGAGPYNLTVTATSVNSPTTSNTVTNRLTTITPNSVDLTNDVVVASAAVGDGLNVFATPALAVAANGGVAIRTNSVNPGASTTFTLVVNNTSATTSDNYGLSVDTSLGALPTGWIVKFYATAVDLNCTAPAGILTNTGNILAGGHVTVCAVVTIPDNQQPVVSPGQSIVFKVTSSATTATDYKQDAVIVNTVRQISLTPNNGAQIYAGGTVYYKHILQNKGNVNEAGLTVTTGMTGATLNWGNVLYADTNTNGVLDGADLLLGAVSLNRIGTAGDSITVFNKVLAPASAAAGDVNTVLLTASQPNAALILGAAAPVDSLAQDVSTVIAGQINLTKLQSTDLACTGAVNAWVSSPLTANPGECILYQVTGTNAGTTNALNVVISDSTPPNTTYNCNTAGAAAAGGTAALSLTTTLSGVVTTTAPATHPAACATGAISSGTIATMAPGDTAVMTFGVRIDK